MKSAIFLERDGILTVPKIERNQQVQPVRLEELRLNMKAQGPLQKLKDAGFLLLVTTNQPGISRGELSRRELDRMHEALRRAFPLDGILICAHDEQESCPCRKPKPGLLLEAAFQWHLDLERCYVVSDKWQDARAAHVAGCTSFLLKSPWNGTGHYDFVIESLEQLPVKIEELRTSCVLAMNQGISLARI